MRLLYHEIVSYDHGLQCILKNKNSDSLSIGNIAALFCNSDTITIYISDADSISDSEWKSLVSDFAKIFEVRVYAAIRFQFSTKVQRWRQTELFDLGHESLGILPGSGFKWTRKDREDALIFQLMDEKKQSDSDRPVPGTFREHIKNMFVGLEEEDAEYFETKRKKEAGARTMQLFFRQFRGAMVRKQFLKKIREMKWATNVIWTSCRRWEQRHGLRQWLTVRVEESRIRKLEEQKKEAAAKVQF